MSQLQSNPANDGGELIWVGDEPPPPNLDRLVIPEPFRGEPAARAMVFIVDRGEPAATLLAEAGDESCCRIVVQSRPDAWRAAALIEAGADAVCAQDELASPSLVALRALAAARMRTRLASLSRHSEHLQACIDNLPMPIFFKDADGVYVGCNKAFLAFLGRSAETVIGKTAADVAPPELVRVYNEADRRVSKADEGAEIYEARAPFADGSHHDILFHKSAFRAKSGKVMGVAGAMFDITDRKRLESQLTAAAERDPLTGLYNRRKFFDLAERAREAGLAQGQTLCAMVMDLDWFKSINDRHGHAAGDFVLQKIAELAQAHLRPGDLFGRAGGEEFYALLPNTKEAEGENVAERVRAAIAQAEFLFAGKRLKMTASIGVAEVQPGEERLEPALARADAALYRAKKDGRNRVQGCAAA
ncbi:MAG: diguanylate cyclase [Roseiarcus sp.]|jgi:diguanylate cyclase (GGDEF)-like protein/PAS domain S-box-containing protein